MKLFHLEEHFSGTVNDWIILEKAYHEFADLIFKECQSSNNFTVLYSQLCYARIEMRRLKKNKQIRELNHHIPLKEFYEKALELLEAQLKLVELRMLHSFKNEYAGKLPRRLNPKIKWTGTVTELVELGYAILASRSVNNGEVDLKELMHFLCRLFDFEVKDFYRVFISIRQRRGDRTIYLDKLKNKLIINMEAVDNRKKKRTG